MCFWHSKCTFQKNAYKVDSTLHHHFKLEVHQRCKLLSHHDVSKFKVENYVEWINNLIILILLTCCVGRLVTL